MFEMELYEFELIMHQRNLVEYYNRANMSACANRSPMKATPI